MIGGLDLFLDGKPSRMDNDVMFRLARIMWHGGFVEPASGEPPVPWEAALRMDWEDRREFFLYQSQTAYEVWTEHGFTEEYGDGMIMVTLEPNCIGFAVNAPGSTAHDLVRDMIDAIRQNRREFSGMNQN